MLQAIASKPTAILIVPVVLEHNDLLPKPKLGPPVVLLLREQVPIAVLLEPVLAQSARNPNAVLFIPTVLHLMALLPIAVLPVPVVFANPANTPKAELN